VATLNFLMGGFYLQWKYPKTSRRLTKLFFVCLIIYLPIYFLYVAPPKQIIESEKLQPISGQVNEVGINTSHKEQFTVLTLKEYPGKQFSFDRTGKTYIDLSSIQKGDSVTLLSLKLAFSRHEKVIPSYELKKGGTAFFSLEEYNSSISEGNTLAKVFLLLAISFIVMYFVMEKTGLLKWISRQLSSGDKRFQEEKPNFNEYLDR
jgi:hypothetical protein